MSHVTKPTSSGVSSRVQSVRSQRTSGGQRSRGETRRKQIIEHLMTKGLRATKVADQEIVENKVSLASLNYNQAVSFYEEALHNMMDLKDSTELQSEQLATIYFHLGDLYRKMSDIEEPNCYSIALNYLEKSLKNQTKINQFRLFAKTVWSMALCYDAQADYVQAKKYIRLGLVFLEQDLQTDAIALQGYIQKKRHIELKSTIQQCSKLSTITFSSKGRWWRPSRELQELNAALKNLSELDETVLDGSNHFRILQINEKLLAYEEKKQSLSMVSCHKIIRIKFSIREYQTAFRRFQSV